MLTSLNVQIFSYILEISLLTKKKNRNTTIKRQTTEFSTDYSCCIRMVSLKNIKRNIKNCYVKVDRNNRIFPLSYVEFSRGFNRHHLNNYVNICNFIIPFFCMFYAYSLFFYAMLHNSFFSAGVLINYEKFSYDFFSTQLSWFNSMKNVLCFMLFIFGK